jgi:hypothetical protein
VSWRDQLPMSDRHAHESEDPITRDGVMAAFWRDKLQKWTGVPVCVNAGDVVLEGRLDRLARTFIYLTIDGATGHHAIAYDDIVAVERISVGVPG